MSEEFTAKQFGGCLVLILTMTIVLPIWYALLFWILHTLQAPSWAWVAYWVYVPVGLITGAMHRLLAQ